MEPLEHAMKRTDIDLAFTGNDRRLLVELDWSILAMAVAELLAWKELRSPKTKKRGQKRVAADPAKHNLANTRQALRQGLGNLHELPSPGRDLLSLLRAAVTDDYVRKRPKKARYRPRDPDQKPLGDPELRRLEPEEREKLKKIERKIAA